MIEKGKYTEFTDQRDKYDRPEKIDGVNAILYHILSLLHTPSNSNQECPDLAFHYEDLLFDFIDEVTLSGISSTFESMLKSLYPSVKIEANFSYGYYNNVENTLILNLKIEGEDYNFVSEKTTYGTKWTSTKDYIS